MPYLLKKILMIALIVFFAGVYTACTVFSALNADKPSDDRWATTFGGLPENPSVLLASDLPATAPASQPAADSATTVAIDNFTFSPQTLTVPAGATVTWINHDDIPHTATSSSKVDGKRIFNTGVLDTDQKASFTFKTPGTYSYFCTVHPHMTATIIVK